MQILANNNNNKFYRRFLQIELCAQFGYNREIKTNQIHFERAPG